MIKISHVHDFSLVPNIEVIPVLLDPSNSVDYITADHSSMFNNTYPTCNNCKLQSLASMIHVLRTSDMNIRLHSFRN